MTGKHKKTLVKYAIDFIKLQLSGNILFWGTYLGYFLLHEILHWSDILALATASIIAHIFFFLANKEWVFDDKTGKRKTSGEVVRFVIFMGINYFINLGIIAGLDHYYGLSPYIGQFVAGFFFTFWNFIGLRFWVFQEMQHHAISTRHVRERKKRDANKPKRRTKRQTK